MTRIGTTDNADSTDKIAHETHGTTRKINRASGLNFSVLSCVWWAQKDLRCLRCLLLKKLPTEGNKRDGFVKIRAIRVYRSKKLARAGNFDLTVS